MRSCKHMNTVQSVKKRKKRKKKILIGVSKMKTKKDHIFLAIKTL